MGIKRPLLVFCLLGACSLLGCGSEPPAQPVRPVRAMRVGDISGITGRSFPGQASAAVEVNLSFRVSGPLVAFPVEVGDQVDQGDLFAKIDPIDFDVDLQNAQGQLARADAELEAMQQGARPEELEQLKASVQKAKASYERAQADFDRLTKLVKARAASQEEFDAARQDRDRTQAGLREAEEALTIGEVGAREEDIRAKQAEIKSLRASASAAQNQLNYTELKAPFSGTVTATYVENHEMVQAKQPILRLVDTSRIEFTVDMPESLISLVPYVKDIVCTFREIPDREFPAEVKEVGIEASPTTRTYPVTLIMDNPDGTIYAGMAGDARGQGDLPGELAEEGFEVPEAAVFVDEQSRRYVWAIDESGMTVRRQEVTVGDPSPLGIRVQGLTQGQLIATAGVHYLGEGQKVRILEEPSKEASR